MSVLIVGESPIRIPGEASIDVNLHSRDSKQFMDWIEWLRALDLPGLGPVEVARIARTVWVSRSAEEMSFAVFAPTSGWTYEVVRRHALPDSA